MMKASKERPIREAEGAGFMQKEEKAQGKSYSCLQLPNGKV